MQRPYGNGIILVRYGSILLDADGSAFVIHENPDDHKTQLIGGAGDRIACGAIQGNKDIL